MHSQEIIVLVAKDLATAPKTVRRQQPKGKPVVDLRFPGNKGNMLPKATLPNANAMWFAHTANVLVSPRTGASTFTPSSRTRARAAKGRTAGLQGRTEKIVNKMHKF